MMEPGWVRSIVRLLQSEAHPESRFLSLATLTVTGCASVRTVVFRGFLRVSRSAPAVQITTDTRSDKIPGIEKSPWAELCWYFPNAREQFRIAGTATLVRATEQDARLARARVESWQKLSDGTRASFGTPAPGTPLDKTAEAKPVDPLEPASSFALLLVDAVKVDHLALRSNDRVVWRLTEEDNSADWECEEVHP